MSLEIRSNYYTILAVYRLAVIDFFFHFYLTLAYIYTVLRYIKGFGSGSQGGQKSKVVKYYR